MVNLLAEASEIARKELCEKGEVEEKSITIAGIQPKEEYLTRGNNLSRPIWKIQKIE